MSVIAIVPYNWFVVEAHLVMPIVPGGVTLVVYSPVCTVQGSGSDRLRSYLVVAIYTLRERAPREQRNPHGHTQSQRNAPFCKFHHCIVLLSAYKEYLNVY